MKIAKVSKLLVKRLELYLNYLKTLPDTVVNISATSIARALELGETEGAMSGLAIGICGLMTAVLSLGFGFLI